MSVNGVTGTSLQRDLASALRLSRAVAARSVEAGASTPASKEPTPTHPGSSASQTTGTASTPALSSDLMSSLLQLQSDFSQVGLQNGVTSPADPSSAADGWTNSDAADAAQAGNGTARAHRHHRHGAQPAHTDSSDGTQAAASGTSDARGNGQTATAGPGSGIDGFLQQVTKAIAAYATGGPVGLATAALTDTSKA